MASIGGAMVAAWVTNKKKNNHMNTAINTCSKYQGCSAAYCPETKQGFHAKGDSVCSRTGLAWSKDFNKDCKGISSLEAHKLIQRRFDKQQHPVIH